ncbi:MAG: hypothetical protein E7442_03115 [Ruminococcaceae bacterium]|nr:hypothetical protein [Oscillospiraceae bacterium]
MARKNSQDSYSDAEYGYEEDFAYEEEDEVYEEPVYEKKGLFARLRHREEDDVYEDESYDDDYDEYEDEEEEPRRGFFKSFGRKKKAEPEYEEFEEDREADDEYEDEYEEEEEEKTRFRLFGGRSRRGEDKDEYERYAEPQDYEDDDDAIGLDRIFTVILAVLMVVALAVSIFAVVTLLQSGAGEKGETAEQEAPAVMETIPPSEAELQASQTAAEATPEPTGSRAVLTEDGILVPGERGPVVPERDVKKPIEEFATVTMIGNSFVEGMKLWSDISCEYVCADGVSLDNMIGNHLYFVTVRDYDAIYLTLGLNEIGWPVDSFISKYEKVIDYIRSDAYSKTATIYITSVMPVEKIMETQKAESGYTINLSKIQTFNKALQEMCQRKGVWYMDVYSALADAEGYLPADVAADDHVHFEKTGYRIWTEYLQSHYVDESLLEG